MEITNNVKKSIVYFTSFRSTPKSKFFNRFKNIFEEMGIKDLANKNNIVGIKTHFGEGDNTTYVHPYYIRKIIELIKPYGWKVFVTDTNTIYAGQRVNAIDHIELALRHGFSFATLGVPVIIADGIRGNDYCEIEIKNSTFYKKVKVASGIANCDALIVVTHLKAHIAAGFGGALKNIGMGCAARPHKFNMHSNLAPKINKKKCAGCGECIKWCPSGAIKVINQKAQIDPNICIGCGECISACPQKCINLAWDETAENLQKKFVETAAGVIKSVNSKIFYINFVNNVTPDCDCISHSDVQIVPDIGVLFSYDPVAIDKASVDLVNQSEGIKGSALDKNFEKGEDKFKALHPNVDWNIQLIYAEKIGIGTNNYELRIIN